ncbi:MAG: T9SS type A sorting domain-containing protein [Bacteroidetes bacterium]|nr:T9SS type A sorting domain-containing protein [Bacteroidota bacterium]
MKIKTTFFLLLNFATFAAHANIGVPFWQEVFDAGFPTGWSTGDASGQGVLWEQCSEPGECPPAIFDYISCKDSEFRSPSFEDGYMFVNSFEHGAMPVPHISYLRTGAIDCSDKQAVFLKFHTYIHSLYTNPDSSAILRVRAGNGPWMSFVIFPNLNIEVSENLQSWNAQPVFLDISSVAANQPNITIEWRWTANFEIAWMVDDVALFDENPLYGNAVWVGQGDFNGGQSGWTVTNQLDTCKWVWDNTGLVDYPDSDELAEAIACWPSVSSGAMVVNASFCTYPGGGPSEYSRSDLKSPVIDLSAAQPGTRLVLKFNQMAAITNPATTWLPITSVAVSIDNGATYIDTIDANPMLPFQQRVCGEATLQLPESVAGKPQVRLTFIFSGDGIFWMVDDIRIVTQHNHDLRINPLFFSVAPDFQVPSNQVTPITLSTQVQNIGNQPLNDVSVFAQIKNQDNEWVFQDTIFVGTVMPGELVTDLNFTKKFTPVASPAAYVCYYQANADEPDSDDLNNVVRWKYNVGDTVFSKNDFCSINGYFRPGEDVKYEVGNCYYVPNGNHLNATSMSFAFKNAAILGNLNAKLRISLYRWKTQTGAGDQNSDTLANFNEFELVAFNEYPVDGDENGQIVTVPVSEDNSAIPLEDGTYYFVTVGYLNPVSSNGNPVPFFIGGSEEINYTSMFYQSYPDGLPRYVSMLREGDDLDFRANAWALRRIPFINLNVQQLTPTIFRPENSAQISLSPNPAGRIVWLNGDFDEMQRRVEVEIIDICGRLVAVRHFENTFVSQLPIDLRSVSNGSYTLRVVTENKVGSAKLLVVGH